jgi:hypothetical protein
MSNFFYKQGRTRVYAETPTEVGVAGVLLKPQAKTRGERRSEEKGPFMDGN